MGLQERAFKLSYGPSDDRLHGFYIPALQASVRYDRMTGFFTSSALAVAAAGVAHLIAGGGRMRLLVGAQLEPQDVDAIREGHDLREVVAARLGNALPNPETLADQMVRDRLAALAWMVATSALEIRAVLPTGPDGLPLPASEARDYFHPKVGIFTDAHGHRLAFSGSVNESETGWRHNYEQFMVFRSWTEEGQLYVAVGDLKGFVQTFPQEGGPQGGVPVYHALPARRKGRDVEVTAECPARLLEIHAGLWGNQAVEEHPKLHGRKRVYVFYGFRVAHRLILSSILSSFFWSSFASAKSEGV